MKSDQFCNILSGFTGRVLTEEELKSFQVHDHEVFSKIINDVFLRGVEAGEQSSFEFVNSSEFADMMNISKQAFHDRYKRSLNPNSTNGLPTAAYSNDGKNPIWIRTIAQNYTNSEKEKKIKKITPPTA